MLQVAHHSFLWVKIKISAVQFSIILANTFIYKYFFFKVNKLFMG